ncbi:Hypothetical predicted protein, partial [Scomber scombrus]
KWNEVDGVNYVFFMNLSSLPVTTGGRYELRGKLIYRDVQSGAIIMSSKFEADWMKYVGVRATRMYMASTPKLVEPWQTRPLTYGCAEHNLSSAMSGDVAYLI